MLIRFRVSNFKSIRDEQELSMVAGNLVGPTEQLRRVEGLDVDLLTVAAIYGPNASGKSTVLEALRFVREGVAKSHRSWSPEGPIPRQPFLLSAPTVSEPSSFEVEFVIDPVRYRYGFVLDSERIRAEWLYAYPRGREQVWFVRDADVGESFRFDKHLLGENRTIQSITRENSLFLSAAAQNNHPQLLPIYAWIVGRIQLSRSRERTRSTQTTRMMMQDRESRSAILDLLAFADLGIVGVDVDRKETGRLVINGRVYNVDAGDVPPMFKLRHRAAGVEGGVSIPLKEESQGTQALLGLAVALQRTLRSGGVLCVDELDASLHPAIAREIVRLFHDPSTNLHGAQLIFNTHDTNLLDAQVEGARLRRDQIWFTEKDDAGATHLYPLTDFKLRADENLERGYLQGRYGAIPIVGSLSFLRDAARDDGEGQE